MKIIEKIHNFQGFEKDWRRLIIQGIITLLVGLFMALASVTNSNAIVFSAREFSWLPICGAFLLLLGILGCLKAFIAKEPLDIVQNLQVGVLDFIVGLLIILSISDAVSRLTVMVSMFLLVRGIVRLVFVYTLTLPHKFSTSLGGLASISLGILVFVGWPTSAAWFTAFSLSMEIAFRGWAGISFALWVKGKA